MIQVICRTDSGHELTAINTDSSDRAAEIANVVHTNGHYAEIFVMIGNKRFAYSEFIKQLEKV